MTYACFKPTQYSTYIRDTENISIDVDKLVQWMVS